MRYAMCDPINLAVQRVQLLSSLRVRGRATELRRCVDSGFVFRVCTRRSRARRFQRPAWSFAQGAPFEMTKTTERQGFKIGEFIVYPAHGVGQIVSIDEEEIAGTELEFLVINFAKDKMRLRVPTDKIASVGIRKLADG